MYRIVGRFYLQVIELVANYSISLLLVLESLARHNQDREFILLGTDPELMQRIEANLRLRI